MATQQQLDNLLSVVPFARASAKQYGVPASVTLAQWVLESGWGLSALSLQCNNYFGIKAVTGEAYGAFSTHEFVAGREVTVDAHFAKYASPADSFNTHAHLLATLPRYAPAMRDRDDIAAFCSELQLCGYSTSPTYAASLLQLIREHTLTQYDTVPPAAAA